MSAVEPGMNAANRHSARLTREEVAKLEIGPTAITRPRAWYLFSMFLLSIFAVPITEHVAHWRAHSPAADTRPLPRAYEVFALLPAAVDAYRAAEGSLLDRVLTANRATLSSMQEYERLLEDESLFVQAVLPQTQWALTKALRLGNESAYVGVKGWLFYRPEIEYVTGPPFLSPRQLKGRSLTAGSTTPVQPDPRPAIMQFHKELAERGIRLVLMPTPVKPTIHPERFAATGRAFDEPLHNQSYEAFKNELARAGVLVYDPTDVLIERKRARKPVYLATDTHWTPMAMELVAENFAEWIADQQLLSASMPVPYTRKPLKVANVGDIAAMLRLPKKNPLFKRQRVQIRQVIDEAAGLWRPASSADVLVLGDSFSNIYSSVEMGWGESAGFVEQLSFHLKRPLDQITQNDGGAFATRQSLSRMLAQGRDRLAGKQLVIWQFASRELAVGDWKLLDMKLGEPSEAGFLVAPMGGELMVRGMIEAISSAPLPGTVPYKDHILCVHLVDVEIQTPRDGLPPQASQCVVYLWSMRDNVRQSAAALRPGQELSLRLRPWSDVSERYDAINRSELADSELQLEEPNWGEVVE